MKKVFVIAFVAMFALCLTACGGSNSAKSASSTSEQSSTTESASSSVSTSAVEKFDGSSFSDTGAGGMALYGPGGNTEDGSILQVAVKKNTLSTQLGIDYFDGDGSVCTVYIDGIENMKMNAAQYREQSSLNISDESLQPGIHTVEFVCMDGDTPKIYKKAQYEIVI